MANLPTPGMSLAWTMTVPRFAVTAAAAASQSATSKYGCHRVVAPAAAPSWSVLLASRL